MKLFTVLADMVFSSHCRPCNEVVLDRDLRAHLAEHHAAPTVVPGGPFAPPVTPERGTHLYSPAGAYREHSVPCSDLGCRRDTFNVCARCDYHCQDQTVPVLMMGVNLR